MNDEIRVGSFAAVRCPYTRVLSAFDQRMRGDYEGVWGSAESPAAPPADFGGFMRWLEQQHKAVATSGAAAERPP